MAQQNLLGQGLLIIEVSRSHSVGLLWTSDQPDEENSTGQNKTQETDILARGGIRTHNPSKRTQTHALDRAATGIGNHDLYPPTFTISVIGHPPMQQKKQLFQS
jgi:hypothetical protein